MATNTTDPSSTGNNVKLRKLDENVNLKAYNSGFINLGAVEPSLGIPSTNTFTIPSSAYYFPVIAITDSYGDSRKFTNHNDTLVLKNDKIGINTTDPNEKLTVVGNISATGNVYFLNKPYDYIEEFKSIQPTHGNNTASGYYSNIGGGVDNCALNEYSNIAGGFHNCTLANYSNVDGGNLNKACGDYSNINGGIYNETCKNFTTISGGYCNIVNGEDSGILGGRCNLVSNNNSFIIGSNITTSENDTTYFNNISAEGFVYGDGSCLRNVISVYCYGNGTYTIQPKKGDNLSDGVYSNIGGGCNNIVNGCTANIDGGLSNTVIANYSTIGGGTHNCIDSVNSTIGGGVWNYVHCVGSTIGGGGYNNAYGVGTTVAGGFINNGFGYYNTIGGGQCNTASGIYSTISGGYHNTASAYYGTTVGGGINNTASGYYGFSVISGGLDNCTYNDISFIGGGYGNNISGFVSSINGGRNNAVSGNYSNVVGGCQNQTNGNYSTVSGGYNNISNGTYTFIGGGCGSVTNGDNSVIAGGDTNATYCFGSTIGGGSCNVACGIHSSILGGRNNNTNTKTNSHIIGSYIIANDENYTYVNNLSSEGFLTGAYLNVGPDTYINTSGGGSIDTTGTGFIQLGTNTTRTTLSGVATENRTILLRDKDGTVALLSDLSGLSASNQPVSSLAWTGTLNTTDLTEIFIDGITSNRAVLDDYSIWILKFDYVAINTVNGNIGSGQRLATIKRDNGANTTEIIGLVQNIRIDQNNGTNPLSLITINADNTNGALAVSVTPESNTTTKVKFNASYTELKYN